MGGSRSLRRLLSGGVVAVVPSSGSGADVSGDSGSRLGVAIGEG